MIQGMIMEHIGTFWSLKLSVTIQLNVVRLALKNSIVIELAHNIDIVRLSFSIRLLIALRYRLLKTIARARSSHYTLCSALRLMKKALLYSVLSFFAAAHAHRLPLIVAQLCLQCVYFRSSRWNIISRCTAISVG